MSQPRENTQSAVTKESDSPTKIDKLQSELRRALREEMRSAIRAEQDVKKQINECDAALATACTTLEQAKATLLEFNDLDGELRAWRVQQAKAGATSKTLPGNLKAKVDRRREIQEEISGTEEAISALQEELALQKSKHRVLVVNSIQARLAVLTEFAEASIIEEYRAVSLRSQQLRQLFYGLQNMRNLDPGNGLGKFLVPRISPYATLTMQGRGELEYPRAVEPLIDMGDRWKVRLQALADNPDVEISVPRPIAPSDYLPPENPRPVGPGSAMFAQLINMPTVAPES